MDDSTGSFDSWSAAGKCAKLRPTSPPLVMEDVPMKTRRQFLATGLALPVLPATASAAFLGPQTAPPTTAPARSAQVPLQYRRIGRTDIEATTVSMGCMVTSDASVIERAADMGVRLFDTARVYQKGNNEPLVGAALKSRRNKVFIVSKSTAGTKEEALKNLDESLAALGTDHLDIWHLHAKKAPEDLNDGLLEAQKLAREQGKIRYAGVSFHQNHEAMIDAVLAKKAFDVVLLSYNFSMKDRLDSRLQSLHDAGIGVIGMKVMAGAYPNKERLRESGAALAALRWTLRKPVVHTTIPSMTDMDQLEENLKAMAAPFAPEDEKTLAAHLEEIKPLYCRMCGECTGVCPKGLPVADMLRFLSYADGYGQYPLGREHFTSLSAEQQAVRCGDCPTCAVECRNGVAVVARLSRAQELFARA
jgi:uncharacterized protein